MGRVDGKVALITGAARGQGRSHALRLAEEGADIIALDIAAPVETVPYPMAKSEDLDETVRQVEARGRRAVGAVVDVRDLSALVRFLEQAVAELGRLDIVCANAGVLSLASALDLSEQEWQTVLNINLTGVWKTMKAAVPHVINGGRGGSLIITSSIATEMAYESSAHYTAAKSGAVGFSRVLAKELAPHKIRVNTVHPTNVVSGMTDNEAVIRRFRPDLESPTYDDFLAAAVTVHPLEIGALEPIEISNAVVYLASDESRYVTGTKILIDAGTRLL